MSAWFRARRAPCEPSDLARRYDASMAPSPPRDLFATATLLILANGPMLFVARRLFDLPGTWEGPIIRPLLLAVAIGGVLFLVLDPSDPLRALDRRQRLVVAAAVLFGFWGAISTLWSVNPDVSLWRGLVYASFGPLALVFVGLGDRRFIGALAASFGALLLVSLVLIAAWPDVGLDRNDDWRGVFTNRNSFAPACGIAAFAGIASAQRHRILGMSTIMLAVMGLAGAGSRTAWLAFLVSCGLATAVVVGGKWSERKPGPLVPALVGGGVGAGVVAVAVFVSRYWNESTLVQRRIIWDLLFDHIKDRPIHGHGFQGFWTVGELIGQHELLGRGSAHNSAVEVLLETGIIGLVLWSVVVFMALAVTAVSAWRSPSVATWLWLALTVFLFVENLTESHVNWFSYNWLLLIVAAAGPLRSRPARVEHRTPPSSAVANG